MERIEIFKGSNGKLCVEIYKNMNDKYSAQLLRGEDATNFIFSLKNKKIKDVYEFSNEDEIVLMYKDSIVRLNEFKEIMYKKGIRPLREKIKEIKETESLSSVNNKKVKRKNKHVGKTVIPLTMVAIISLSTFGIVQGINALENNVSETTSITQVEEKTQKSTKYVAESINEEIKETEQETSNTSKSNNSKKESNEKKEDNKNIVVAQIPVDQVSIDYKDRSDMKKPALTKSLYGDMIKKYSKTYGLDYSLVLAIATQERGVHSSVMDAGGATGLMQVQNAVWENQEKTAYNFETKEYERFIITKDMLGDASSNIRVGCTIFQECLKQMDYNIVAAIQCYNMGYGNMIKILNAYSSDTGRSIDAILSDQNDIGWLNYRYLINQGDQEYLEHVLSWMGEDLDVAVLKDNNETVCLNIIANKKSFSLT